MTVTDRLRAAIVSGRLAPGAALLQTELAAEFGVSRIPVRDALQNLASEKLVTLLPGKGAQVIALSRDELSEIYDLRILLECDLLRRATTRANAHDHAEAEYALRRSSLEAGRPGWTHGDWAFHAALYAPANRPRQIAMIRELRTTCEVYARRYEHLAEATSLWLEDHGKIHAAFVAGQPDDAAEHLSRHIDGARQHLMEIMAQE
jgi:DNA-binding GntR family transcriptional regulator